MAFSSLAETRDNETGKHIRRTQNYVSALANALADHPRFVGQLDRSTIELLHKSAPLHDIGKVAIPDRILLKPGRLTPEEFEVMKTHTIHGRAAIETVEASLNEDDSFLLVAREIASFHHEKWDGTGYPHGLAGEDIPLAARLMAVADVYDALISRRVYKPPMPHQEAMEIIREGIGHHFDPDIAQAFLVIEADIAVIARQFADFEEVSIGENVH